MATIKAANTAGEFEGQFDTVLAGLEYAGLTTLLEGKALMTVGFLFLVPFLCSCLDWSVIDQFC